MSKKKKNKKYNSVLEEFNSNQQVYKNRNSENWRRNVAAAEEEEKKLAYEANEFSINDGYGCIGLIVILAFFYFLIDDSEEQQFIPISTSFKRELILDINTQYKAVNIIATKDFNPTHVFYDVVNNLEVSNFKFINLNMSETKSLFSSMGMSTSLEGDDSILRGSVFILTPFQYYIGLDLYRKSFTNTNKDTLFVEIYKAIAGNDIEKEMLYKDIIIEEPNNSLMKLCPAIVLNKKEFRIYNYNQKNELIGREYIFPKIDFYPLE